jgi:hypothetical protein
MGRRRFNRSKASERRGVLWPLRVATPLGRNLMRSATAFFNAVIDAHWIYGTHCVNLADMKTSRGRFALGKCYFYFCEP